MSSSSLRSLERHGKTISGRKKVQGQPTFGDHALQVNDVRMVKLAHDAGLGQEVPPLFVGVASLEGLDGHTDLSLARHLQASAAHLTELACNRSYKTASRGEAGDGVSVSVRAG